MPGIAASRSRGVSGWASAPSRSRRFSIAGSRPSTATSRSAATTPAPTFCGTTRAPIAGNSRCSRAGRDDPPCRLTFSPRGNEIFPASTEIIEPGPFNSELPAPAKCTTPDSLRPSLIRKAGATARGVGRKEDGSLVRVTCLLEDPLLHDKVPAVLIPPRPRPDDYQAQHNGGLQYY